MFGFRRRRRARLRATAPPAHWQAILERNVPYVARLDAEDRRELLGLVQVFLAEKRFEGCGGLVLDDEIRVTIAAQACVLLLHRETDFYPELDTVLVYPAAYVDARPRRLPDGTVTEDPQVRLGESWGHGVVVLSWDDVLEGAAEDRDGRNVVFHEFAHQLDVEEGGADGAPPLPRRSMYTSWARVLGREYDALLAAVSRHGRTLLDPYGATSPAEFFAVATETFFERPEELRARHPELYAELRAFYQQDPAARNAS